MKSKRTLSHLTATLDTGAGANAEAEPTAARRARVRRGAMVRYLLVLCVSDLDVEVTLGKDLTPK